VQPSWRSLLQRSTRGLESSGFPLPSAGPIPCPTEDGRQRIGLPKPRATTADALAQGASDSFITMPWAGGKPSGYLHSLVVHVDPKHPDPARWSKAMAKGTSAFQLPPNAMSSPGPLEKSGYTRQALSNFGPTAAMPPPAARRMVAAAGDTPLQPQRPSGFALNNSPASAQTLEVPPSPDRFSSTSVSELQAVHPTRGGAVAAVDGLASGYTRAPIAPGRSLAAEDLESTLSALHPKQAAMRRLASPLDFEDAHAHKRRANRAY